MQHKNKLEKYHDSSVCWSSKSQSNSWDQMSVVPVTLAWNQKLFLVLHHITEQCLVPYSYPFLWTLKIWLQVDNTSNKWCRWCICVMLIHSRSTEYFGFFWQILGAERFIYLACLAKWCIGGWVCLIKEWCWSWRMGGSILSLM